MNADRPEDERRVTRSGTPLTCADGRALTTCMPRTLSHVREIVVGVGALVVGVLVGWWLARARRSEAPGPPVEAAAPSSIERQTAEVLDALRSASLIVDASDRVIRSSPTAVALGLVRGQEMVHEELRTLVRSARRDHDLHEVELDLPRGLGNGGRVTLGVRVSPLAEQLVLVLTDDRSQSRRVEETRRDFVVNVSHELKTPVAGLTLLAEAVDDARDDPEAVHRFAKRMRKEAGRLSRLVQEIVELSRLQVAETLDDPQLVDIRECVREAVEHLRLLAEDRQITLLAADSDAGPAEVFGDANLLTTAIRNLIENAVNYSGPGTAVTITARTSDGLLTIEVKDQGRGIAPADLDRVFERFYRVDTARSRRTGGTGLGLAIVKNVCANHGGEVSVWSEEGHGSTFTIRLPAAQPAVTTAPEADTQTGTNRKVAP